MSVIKKVNDILAGPAMTAVAFVCLVLSFVLPRVGISLPADPAWAAVIICGLPLVYLSVWRIIYNPGISKISSALLITIAMFASIAIGDIFAAGEVGFIMSVGAILEDMTTEKARTGLKNLISLAPATGRRVTAGGEEAVPADQIRTGDILRILPGETVPADGIIMSGTTSVDQSVITGESVPADKAPGDAVYCGTINRYGSIDIKATSDGTDTSLQKMIRMVEEADEKKAPMQRIADRWASILVPVAAAIAIIAGLATGDITRTVTVFVVFCPCALVLATPTAIAAAIGQATKHGVLIRSGEALERMGKLSTIAFDKTGTLTLGHLEVTDIIPQERAGEVLFTAACAEARSEHPIAGAIMDKAAACACPPEEVTDFIMVPGRGISAKIESSDARVLCGNEEFIKENGIDIDEETRACADALYAQGKAVVWVAENGICIGLIALADTIRPETQEVIAVLNGMGVNTVLLTGDNASAAGYFSQLSGMKDVRAGLMPQDKVSIVEELKADGRLVCMVGDGVNDAPALKTADVGIAMGSMGSDIAIEASDIALMSDDITKLPYLKRLSRATVNTIHGCIALSMSINFVAVVLSVMGILTPTTGALVHNCGSCLVVLIAAMLYNRRF